MRERTAEVLAQVDGERVWRRLLDLSCCGATPGGGVCRLALSEEEVAARALLVRWGAEIGLVASHDAAGNLFLRLEGAAPDLPSLLVGSHIDSQPTGGKFDGAYGVIAALEACEAMVRAGRRPRRPVEVVAWMNEEGARFAPGMMGSAVFAGVRRLEDVLAVEDAAGRTVRESLSEVLAREKHLPMRPLGFPVAGFIEAHIEQGTMLERAKVPVGIVTGIQGKRTFRVVVEGAESHAGTTPRRERRDALVSAVDILKALQTELWDPADEVRFTIGRFEVTPNAPSVVPGRVQFSIDLRHDAAEVVRDLGDRIAPTCERARGVCAVSVRELLYDQPVAFPPTMRDLLAGAARDAGLPSLVLGSPAGHDARYLHRVCPTGMVFVPCRDGLSHNEAESIEPGHAEAGARVVAAAAYAFASAD